MGKVNNTVTNFTDKCNRFFGSLTLEKACRQGKKKGFWNMRKVALHNLGCKVNAYETESMRRILEEAGYEIVPFEEQADVYVINTCSVTNMADRKSRQMIHRARKRNPGSVVVAAGCYVQTAEEHVREDGAADILIGNNKKHELADLLEHFFAEREKQKESMMPAQEERNASCVLVENIAEDRIYEESGVNRAGEHTRAFVKVQDGCNQFCSYCIIPYARGRVRSRNPEHTLREVEALAANGYREVVLTGIHLSSYGTDLNRQDTPAREEISLLALVQKVHEIKGIERIRLGSLEPKIVTEDFVRALSKLPKVCPHFHLSLQSGCDATLKRMNRKYTCEEYAKGCGLLRKYFTHPAITTDVIVGFPGETEDEFAVTRKFLKSIGFFEIHIFRYSRREGTPAAGMEHQIPEQVKAERSDALFTDLSRMNREFLDWYSGREVGVLMEEEISVEGKKYFLGHTGEYVKAAVHLPDGASRNLANKLVKGRVASVLTEDVLLLEFMEEE